MRVNSFDVIDYGASPEKKINTSEIQKAIDACYEAGGGIVVCGSGQFVTGTLEIKSNVELYLEPGCVIKGSGNILDYPDFEAPGFRKAPEGTSKHLIRAVEADNIAITGSGTIDASGILFYSAEEIESRIKPKERPRTLMFYRCRNVRLQDVSMVDAPCWTVWLMKCENVCLNRLKISGDCRLMNNDGIDIDSCRNVTVSDCIIDTEDDCIVLRAMRSVYDEPGICENIIVTNCILSSRCNAIRIGCPGDFIVRHCAFSNITISGRNGIIAQNPKRYLSPGREASADISDIVFSNFSIDCTGIPVWIIIEEGIRLKRLAGLSFDNFRIRSGAPCIVQGSSETTIEDLSFSNIKMETKADEAVVCKNCRGVRFNNVEISNEEKSDRVIN